MRRPLARTFRPLIAILALLGTAQSLTVATPVPDLWSRDNLVAWCIVPFDTKKRDAATRAQMLRDLHLRQLAYDWRAEHVPFFDDEVVAMKRLGIEIVAWWFPTKLDDTARRILDVITQHKIQPQLWVAGGSAPLKDPAEQSARVASEVVRLKPIAEAAAQIGCKVGLYNHGGWFGEPENQLAILARLRDAGCRNVGLVYNFHHGHDHLARFAAMWPRIQADTFAVNLNGMVADGDKTGKKILYLGEGDRELAMMRIVQASGWRGLVGILNHRMDTDAAEGLRRNLAGLELLARELNHQR